MGYIYPKVLVPFCSLENGLSNGTSSITVRLSEAKLLNVRHSTRTDGMLNITLCNTIFVYLKI